MNIFFGGGSADTGGRAWAAGLTLKAGDLVTNGGKIFRVSAAHTSDAAQEPGVGPGWGSVYDGYPIPVSTPAVPVGSTDNCAVRADGTGGGTAQGSDLCIRDASTGTQSKLTLTNNHSGQTNSAFVISPKGTGAFIVGPEPDGLSTGGNARGANALDLQTLRNAATQVASGSSAVAIGVNTTSSGVNSVAIGSTCVASGQFAFARGRQALADRFGQDSFTTGAFAVTGDAQSVDFHLRCRTTTNTPVEMALDGGTTYLTIPAGKVLSGILKITGVKSDGSAVAVYLRQVTIRNASGITALIGTVNTLGTDTAAGTSVSITANDTGDYLSVLVTGVLSETWRWVARFTGQEVAYGT